MFKTTGKKLIASTILALLLGGLFSVPAKAQLIVSDPVAAPAVVTLAVGTQVKNVDDKVENFAWATLKKIGASAYKTAGAAVLNTVAAEMAKAIATGDFGGPMFSFDKSFFSALADGVVGDLVNDIVNGALGIDLCNFDPNITLQFALKLPFFKEYKYEPKCSLTKMSAHLQTLNVKKMFSLKSKIGSTTVESFGQIAESIKLDPIINKAAIVKIIDDFNVNYGAGSDFLSNLNDDKSVLADMIAAAPNEQSTMRDESDFADSTDDLNTRREKYQCDLAKGLQQHALAIFQGKDFEVGGEDPHGKDLKKCVDNKSIDPTQWRENWWKGAKDWIYSVPPGPDEDTPNLSKLLTQMDGKAAKANINVTDAKNEKKTYHSPIVAGMERVQNIYATCLGALNKVLDAKMVGTPVVIPKEKSAPSKVAATSTGENIVFDLDVAPGTYSEVNTRVVVQPSNYVPSYVLYNLHNITPSCPDFDPLWLADVLPSDGSVALEVTLQNDRTWLSNLVSVPKTANVKIVVCSYQMSGAAPLPALQYKSDVKSFNYIIDPAYVAPVALNVEKPLTAQAGGKTFQETFYSPNVAMDPKNPSNLSDVYITYSQTGGMMSEMEFEACQVAFNSATLLSNFDTANKISWIPGAYNYDDGQLKIKLGLREIAMDPSLGNFAGMFNPDYVTPDSPYDWYRLVPFDRSKDNLNGPEFFQAFIRYTLALDLEGQGKGQKLRGIFKDVINHATAAVIGVHEVVGALTGQIDQLFYEGNFAVMDDTLSAAERMNEFDKNLEPGSNEKATSSQITKSMLDAKYKKKSEEEQAALEKGTLVNPSRSAVSEQAKNPTETTTGKIDSTVKGTQPGFASFTGEIFADAMNVFLQTLWNQLLTKGLSELNPGLRKQLGIDPGLEAKIKEQQDCQKDPTKCKTALAGQQFGKEVPCGAKDLDILKSLNSIGKSLGNLATTGSGKIDGVTDKCQKALDTAKAENGGTLDLSAVLRDMQGLLEYLKGLTAGVSSGQGLSNAPGGGSPVAAPTTVELSQRAETKNPTPAFTSAFDGTEMADLDLGNPDSYQLLDDMVLCPKSPANPNLYNCTIDGKLRNAITQGLTVKQALDKKLLNKDLVIGVDEKGKAPLPGAGISLAAAQKLRKARILPIGFEFAARLKVACYQDKVITGDSGDETNSLPAEHPYKDIHDECNFNTTEPNNELRLFLRAKVLSAKLGDIINGFSQSGGDNFICGDFTPFRATTDMSPFCGLMNPDWVLKVPTPRCDLYEYSDILKSTVGNNRYQTCTELTSDLGNGNFGYCLKERNLWSFSGQSCPAQYSTCTSYVFKDGTTDSFNKDSLVGGGLCNERNAGCTWVSSLKQGFSWQDTAQSNDRDSCLRQSGTWDPIANRCVNSRVYINGNIGFCTAADAGCTEVKLFKQPAGNLALDGSFEFNKVDTVPAFWNVGRQVIQPVPKTCVDGDSTADPKIPAGGIVSASCTNVPYKDSNTCLANGGSWDGTICSNASMSGITDQIRCGVCTMTGGDSAKDQSNSLFDSTTCPGASSGAETYVWKAGVFNQLCSQQEVSCNPVEGACTIDYSMYDTQIVNCQSLKDGVFTPEVKASVDGLTPKVNSNCRYMPDKKGFCKDTTTVCHVDTAAADCAGKACLGTQTRGDAYPDNPSGCAKALGTFSYSCPLSVRNTNATQGGNSMVIGLDSKSFKAGETIIASYPLKLAEEASILTLAGDSFSVSFDLSGSTLPDNYVVRAELVKTYNGGRLDSKSLTSPLQTDFQRYTMNLTTLTNGTDLSLKLYLPWSAKAVARAYVDSIKIEYNTPSQILGGSQLSSSYTDYQNNEARFVKLPPAYLNCRGFSASSPSPKAPGNINKQIICQDDNMYWDIANIYGDGPKCNSGVNSGASCSVNADCNPGVGETGPSKCIGQVSCYRYAPDPLECGIRLCRAEEAGCQMFTPTNGEPKVPGVVGQQDYCPNACNGYDTFKQQPSYFEPSPIAPINYFIPTTAKQCTVKDVGCDQFTNLSLAATVNPIEYYTYLRQCIIPSTDKGEAGFFIWQGSAGGPPQLKTFTLQAEGGVCKLAGVVNASLADRPQYCKAAGGTFTYNGTGGPAVVSTDGVCLESDLGVDLDCLKFFDKTGTSYTRKLSYTIEASADCQQLRKTDSDRQSCLMTNGEWTADNTCVYIALPPKSNSCDAQISGCREYFGNTGHNQYPVSFSNFESGTPSGWTNSGAPVDNPTQGLAVTAESITTQGHSIYSEPTVDSIQKPVSIQTGRNYKLSFWAKNKQAATKRIGAKFSKAPNGREFVLSTTDQALVGGDWKYYEFGPVFVDWTDLTDNNLVFNNIGDIYLDNISLVALQESTYVIKNSWQTPLACDTTNLGAKLPQAQLGCQEYTDTAGALVYLKSFTKLCRETSVGCQLVFNTYNSTNPLAATYNLDNETPLDDVMVAQDKLMAVIINKDSLCTEQAKGCQEVGLPSFSGVAQAQFNQSLFVLNNPDIYDSPSKPILCKDEELGCVELKTFKGDKDFLKVDYANTCDYQTRNVAQSKSSGATGSTSVNGWFKTGTGIENQGCSSTVEGTKPDCAGHGGVWNNEFGQCTSAISGLEFNDCSGPSFTDQRINELKTSCTNEYKGSWYNDGALGCGCAKYPFDYYKNSEYPEHNVAAARCDATADQCTEFLDFNPNYIFNGDFETENIVANESGQQGTALYWNSGTEAATGEQHLESGQARSGSLALKLTKDTNKDLPDGGRISGLAGSPFYLKQPIARLERGSTYEVNFAFRSDRITSKGTISGQDDGSCRMPEAAIELVPLLTPEQANAISKGSDADLVTHKDMRIFEPTGEWKRVTTKFLIPKEPLVLPTKSAGITNTLRSDKCTALAGIWTAPKTPESGAITQASCTAVGFTWSAGKCYKPNITTVEATKEDMCAAEGMSWDTSVATPFCSGVCYLTQPGEPAVNYEVRLFAPPNGACVNTTTGAKKYFDDKGQVLDRYLCEGSNAVNTPGIILSKLNSLSGADFGSHYAGYEGRLVKSGTNVTAILDYDDLSARGQGDAWRWEGNCMGSNYLMDSFQISPERESLYHFVDNGKIKTCGSPNWDQGCIEFENVLSGQNVKLQVKPDRQCSEWLYCDPNIPKVNGRCASWTTCTEQDGPNCTKPGSQLDRFRYDLNVPPSPNTAKAETTLNPLNILAYQKRTGLFEDYQINRWRSGDYDGYSIPMIPPIEQLYNQIPGVKIAGNPVPAEVIPKYASGATPEKIAVNVDALNGNDPRVSSAVNNAIFLKDPVFASAALSRICRGYPEETSPFPKVLSNFVPGFGTVNTITKGDGTNVGLNFTGDPNERLAICNYVKYSLNKGQQEFYFTDTPGVGGGLAVCDSGRSKGSFCKSAIDCADTAATQAPACLTPVQLAAADPSGTFDARKAILTDSLGQKAMIGNIGVCLEEESLIKVTGGFLGDITNATGSGTAAAPQADGVAEPNELNQRNTPNACLTFFPL